MQPITVLSLFDWMSCGRLALERAGIPVASYYASEIDRYAIQVATKNFPDIKEIGDVEKLFYTDDYWGVIRERLGGGFMCDRIVWEWKIDLLIGGSPCQWFSNAGKGLNFEDPRSKLFFEFVRILNEAKPRFFLLENVKMKKEWQNIISEHLFGIQPVEIDSALVSAQRRKRLYRVWKRNEDWSYSQVVISQPEDKGILLRDVIDYWIVDQDKSYCVDANYAKGGNLKSYAKGRRQLVFNSIYQIPRGNNAGGIKEGKSPTISSNCWQHNNFVDCGKWYRRLTPIECERLQTLPDNYTEWVSNSQRYKMLGNGWTVDVIAHIFREMFKD